MNLWTFLSSAAGGGVFGTVLHAAMSFFDLWRKGKEQEQAERMMRLQAELGEKTEAWKAFTASQSSNSIPPMVIPSNVGPWGGTIAVLVDAFTRSTRPGLTWVGAGFVTMVYLTSPAEVRQAMAPEINFSAWTMMYWWFGARYQKK